MPVTCKILPSGALRVTANNETRREIADALRAGRGYWSTLWEAFERYAVNGSYEPFNAGDANPFVGLTSAPCVAEEITVEDDGARVIEGRLWWFPDYCLRDPLDELKTRGVTVFALAEDEP